MEYDTNLIAIIGTGISVTGLIYSFIRNFRQDMYSRFDKMDKRMREMDKRVFETNMRMDGVYHILLKKLEKAD